MFARKRIETAITLVLNFGTLLAVLLVSIGGTWYLLQHGRTLLSATATMTATAINLSFSPLGMIELGLMTLVATQILRIALLTAFYAWIRDYWFTVFSAFILLTLISASGVF
jgi:uncharacterized membrane protein